MADEANQPTTMEATKQAEEPTRREETTIEATAADAKPADGDVALGDEAADAPKTASPDQEVSATDSKPVDAHADTTKENGDEVAAPAEKTPEVNGTPAALKGPNNRRKSGAGVPEHKKKTPAKKKSAATLHLNVEPGELWFVAMRGFAPWPVIICDEEMLPEALLSKRPVSAKRIDGTYREDFLEGGKNAKDRRYPVMFLGTNEFAWQVNTELQPLELEEVKKEVEAGNKQKKTKALWEAYQIAAEGHDLAYFKELLESHEQAMQKDAADKEAKKQEKDKKAKRKSAVAEEPEDVEMEDVEDAGAASAKKPKSSKKRKKETESDAEPEKPAKTPKTTKLKLNAPKDTSAAKAKKESKPKKTKAKSESEEVESAKPEEKPMTEAERRDKQEKSVLYLRHRLQKGFLSRDQAPKEEEMSNMSDYLKQLETTENLDAGVIKKTKVHKVLKAIVKLNSIPKEEEYNFKKRSSDLLQQWMTVLSIDGETEAAAAAPEPTTNGVNHDKKVDGPKESTEVPEEGTSAKSDAPEPTEGDGDVAMTEAPAKESSADSSAAAETEAAPEVATE